MTRYRYYTCDVFTDTRFGGNQLAVLPEAEGLNAGQMQQIAREFNYSESTFVLPPEQGHDRRVRIFTPPAEGLLVSGDFNLDVGAKIRVKLVSTNVERGFIDFEQAH